MPLVIIGGSGERDGEMPSGTQWAPSKPPLRAGGASRLDD